MNNRHDEYQPLEQTRDFYKWVQSKAELLGHEIKWAAAASEVTNQVTIAANGYEFLGGAENNTLVFYLKTGNNLIRKDVFPDMKTLLYETNNPLKGADAVAWDAEITFKEQTAVDPVYGALSRSAFERLQADVRLTFGTAAFFFGPPLLGAIPFEGDLKSILDRWFHGMKIMGYESEIQDPEFIKMVFKDYDPNSNYLTAPEVEQETTSKLLGSVLNLNFGHPNFSQPPNGIVSLYYLDGDYFNGPVGNVPVVTIIPEVSFPPPALTSGGISWEVNGMDYSLPPLYDLDFGGVDFTNIIINGFSIDTLTRTPEFIAELVSGIDSINTDSISDNFMRYFLEALILVPENLFVSLDVINNEGFARLNPIMEETYTARVMLDHDILMKSDYLATALSGLGNPNPVDAGQIADWIDLFENSPYFNEFIQLGFGNAPYFQVRAVIIGDTISVYTDNDRVYLDKAPLTLDYAIEDIGIDKSGFNFNQAQEENLDLMVENFQTILQHRLDTAATRFIGFINTSDRYAELRSVYRAIAMAKIYKDISNPENPFAHLINSNNFPTSLVYPDSFPREYYNNSAYQILNQEQFTNLNGQVQQIDVWGGVNMDEYKALDSTGLTVFQDEIFAITDTSFLQSNDSYFVNEGNIGVKVPELYPGIFEILPADTNNFETIFSEPIKIKATIFNTGNILAEDIIVSVFDEFYDADSIKQSYKIADIQVDSIAKYGYKEIEISWQSFQVGIHEYRILVDSENRYSEVKEDNNERVVYKMVYSNGVDVYIIDPSDNTIIPDSDIHFSYYAFTPKTGIPSTVTLHSSKDGLLMDQNDSLNYWIPSLSIGKHIITLEATNHLGESKSHSINLDVVANDIPFAEVDKPIQNQTILSGVPYELLGTAFDFQDGNLCLGDSTFWSVENDTIGYGCSIEYIFSELGETEVLFSTINSAGVQVFDTIQVTVLDGSTSVLELDTFPDGNTAFSFCCLDTLGCDTTTLLNLPLNARIVDSEFKIKGQPVLLETQLFNTNTDFSLGTIQNNHTSPAVNNDRGSYKFNRITAALGIDWADPNFQYPPINEKRSFKNGESVVLITYLNDVFVDVELMWIIEYPDLPDYEGGIDTVYGGIGVPQGIYYPVFPYDLPSSKDYWSGIERGDVKVDVYTRLYGTTDPFQFEQSITFTRDFAASETPFEGGNPLKASHTLSADIQSSSPNLPINFGLDTIQISQTRIYSNLALENVSDSLEIYWNWIAPTGEVIDPGPLSVQPPPGQHEWYDWVKAWSYLDVNNTSVASIVGDWELLVGIRFVYSNDTIDLDGIPAIVRDTFTIDGEGNISYPTNPRILVGQDSIEAWAYNGEFRDTANIDLSSILNGYLSDYSGTDTTVNIPIHFTSETAGKILNDSFSVQYALLDISPPIIDSNLMISPSPLLSGQNFTLSAEVTDNVEVNEVTLLFDGQSYDLVRVPNSDIFEITGLQAGVSDSLNIEIEAIDNFGNRASLSTILGIGNPLNSFLPTVSVNPPSWTNATNFQIDWTELGSPIDAYFLQVGANNFENQGLQTNVNLNYNLDGVSNVNLYGQDAIGNSTPLATAKLFLDKTPPNKVTLNAISGINTWQRDTSFLIKWLPPGDIGGGVVDFQVAINDTPQSVGDTLCFLFQTNETGEYEIKARAKDIVDQYGLWSDSLKIMIDLTSPLSSEITSVSHPDTVLWYKNNQPKFQIESQDDHSGINIHRYLFTSNPSSLPNSTSLILDEDTLNVSTLPVFNDNQQVPEGIWYLHLLPVDQVGNFGPISRYRINIDVTAPETTHDITQDTFYLGDTLTFAPMDALSGVKALNYSAADTITYSVTTDSMIIVDTTGNYWLYFFAEDNAGNLENRDSISVVVLDTTVNMLPKIFLQGAYEATTGLMRDDLRAQGLIPALEPYSALPNFDHHFRGGGEMVSPAVLAITGPDAVVDWVFVELRSKADPSQVIATHSALLQRDGDIVDSSDGISPVKFEGIREDYYYIAIKHRNHLGVLTLDQSWISKQD